MYELAILSKNQLQFKIIKRLQKCISWWNLSVPKFQWAFGDNCKHHWYAKKCILLHIICKHFAKRPIKTNSVFLQNNLWLIDVLANSESIIRFPDNILLINIILLVTRRNIYALMNLNIVSSTSEKFCWDLKRIVLKTNFFCYNSVPNFTLWIVRSQKSTLSFKQPIINQFIFTIFIWPVWSWPAVERKW